MPPIRSVICDADTFTVETSLSAGRLTVSRVHIPANIINKPIATIEGWVNTFLDANISDMIVRVHIESVNPQLIWTIGCFDAGTPVPTDWWL